MPTCVHQGCKQDFVLEENTDTSCKYHPGKPVFHEGLKSWSCCSDVNKPELDFDQFMKIPGCQTGSHSIEVPKVEKPKHSAGPAVVSPSSESPSSESVKPTQTTTRPDGPAPTTSGPVSETFTSQTKPRPPPPAPAPIVEEEDDLSVPVSAGTTCKRNGCKAEFVSDEVNRLGDGEGTVCTYHPAGPIFHEGSKGYLCCKPKVLEFEEFLKIEGCKKGRHLFAPKKIDQLVETMANCRIDHYQTLDSVHIDVFAKKADQSLSKVQFDEEQVHLDLSLPDMKRFTRSLNLYGPIIPDKSQVTIKGTKVELVLKKKDNRSWNMLEQTDKEVATPSLTFGVGGRTGTIGGRNLVLDSNNKLRA